MKNYYEIKAEMGQEVDRINSELNTKLKTYNALKNLHAKIEFNRFVDFNRISNKMYKKQLVSLESTKNMMDEISLMIDCSSVDDIEELKSILEELKTISFTT